MTEVIGVLVANQFLHISSQRFEFVYVIRVFGEQSFSAGLVFFLQRVFTSESIQGGVSLSLTFIRGINSFTAAQKRSSH